MSKQLERVTTTWESRFTDCQKCYEPYARKTFPVPASIRNELREAIESQLQSNCSSGGGTNVGPPSFSLPPIPDGKLIKTDPQTWCIAGHKGPQRFCGKRCGGLSSVENLKSTYDRFGTPAPCKDQGSDTPYLQKQTCAGKPIIIGSRPKVTITATYEVSYGVQITSGPCKGATAFATRTFERTYQGFIFVKIYGKGYINYYRKKHCCKGRLSRPC